MADTLKLTPSESLTIRSSTPDLLEVEAEWAPEGSPPPKHFHPEQEEHFEVLSGALNVRVEGEERTLRAGDTIDIPRRAVHQMWNAGAEPARALWQTRPAGRTEQWFRAIDSLQRRVGADTTPSPVAFAPYLNEFRDVFRLAGPQPLLRPALAGLGAIGRLRGHRPAEPPQPPS